MLNINSHQKNYRLKNVKTYLISSVVINENKDRLSFAYLACNAEDPSSIPRSGRCPREGMYMNIKSLCNKPKAQYCLSTTFQL